MLSICWLFVIFQGLDTSHARSTELSSNGSARTVMFRLANSGALLAAIRFISLSIALWSDLAIN
jgi:hypothetical protein